MTRYEIYWNGAAYKFTLDPAEAAAAVDELRAQGGTVRTIHPINGEPLSIVKAWVSNNPNPEELQ